MKTRRGPARAGHDCLRWALATALLAAGGNAAFAADPDHVTFTLQGCNNDGTITLPNGSGDYICPDSAYTTGNLGKNWSELDLVPHRVTLSTGNASPASQTYSFAIEADNCNTYEPGIGYLCADGNDGHPGYDVVSYPTLNTALSSNGGADCTNFSSSAQWFDNSGAQGVVVSIGRTLTLTQTQNSTCVYDWYQRLALGAHLFSGANLHSDLHYSGGQKEVPLPVNEIAPQSLAKTMSASADQSYSWNLTKDGTPVTAQFGDVCAPGAATSQTASITIHWTKLAATPLGVTAIANVTATNPSTRAITVNLTDAIYAGAAKGSDPALDTKSASFSVPANSSHLKTFTVSLPSTAGGVGDWLNDEAIATYVDDVTGLPIPGSTTATASAQITVGTSYNSTADISDSESISGTGLTFSAAAPTPLIGSFDGYTAGTATTGPVDWSALAQTGTGSVTFDKTIYLANKMVGSLGTLSDTAYLDAGPQHLSGSVNIGVNSSATVALTVNKTIPADYFTEILNGAGDKLKVHFSVSGAQGYSNSFTLTFDSSTPCTVSGCTLSQVLSSLTPDIFTVTETGSEACLAGTCTDPPTDSLLTASFSSTQVDLTPHDGSMTGYCSGSANFVNTLKQDIDVYVNVQKITDPVLTSEDADYLWDFALSGPTSCDPVSAGAGAGFVYFQDPLGGNCELADGNYTVTETLKSGWQEDLATPNDGSNTFVCAFHVDTFTDAGTTKSCTFHNTRLGHANVVKTVQGLAPAGTDAFTFQLRQGASVTQAGTILESLIANAGNGGALAFVSGLVPGTHYQLCEFVMPGWLTSLPNPFVPLNGAADGALCSDFTVTAGETKVFSIDNTPPPGGLARTIGFWRNWASCHASNGHQDPVLDETLAAATPPGIKVGSFYLTAGQCAYAVNLLSKSTMSGGLNMAGDPLFRLAAQLIAAELNGVAGAATCPAVNNAVTSANALLAKYAFNGNTASVLVKPKTNAQKADALLADSLATTLDMYNNGLLCF